MRRPAVTDAQSLLRLSCRGAMIAGMEPELIRARHRPRRFTPEPPAQGLPLIRRLWIALVSSLVLMIGIPLLIAMLVVAWAFVSAAMGQ